MLYLSRKIGESIVIGESIEITVTMVSNKQVKLGVEAPRNSPVYRKELWEKIKRENREAVESARTLISNSVEMDGAFIPEADGINNEIGVALDELANGRMPNILDITSKTGALLKKYADSEVLKKENVRSILEVVRDNFKKLMLEMTKKYKVISSEINLITDYLDKLNEAA